MKHARKPTRAEMKLMDKHNYLADAYLVVKHTPKELVLLSKYRSTVVTIDKSELL